MTFQHAEMFLESGGMFGNSARSALGRPDLDTWDLFTRETLQNSWDARDSTSDDDGVTFSIDYVSLNENRARAFKSFFGKNTSGLPFLRELVASEADIPLLIVSDSGTSGLQGATTVNTSKGSNSREDFISFIRNIGRPSNKEMKGGTYGFGKGVFFDMSMAETVLVYTRTVDEHFNPVSRFIAMANSESFTDGFTQFSGRHWWGIEAKGRTGNVFAEPLVGHEADSLASTFFMEQHFTDERPTGTSVAVISPRTGDLPVEKIMRTIANALTTWAWPHMVETVKGLDPIDFSVSLNGAKVPIPDPESDPIISNFVRAYRTCIRYPEPTSAIDFKKEFVNLGTRKWVDITSARPIEFIGRLAVATSPKRAIPHMSVLDENTTHHVALIRGPRMVVNYWKGPVSESEENYAGVFLAAEHLDPIFAASEPPAHDEWNPKTVDLQDEKLWDPHTNSARTTNPVNVVFTKLKNYLQLRPEPLGNEDGAEITQLTAIANNLGGIFSGASGKSLRVSQTPPKKRSSVSKTSKGVSSSVNLSDLIETPLGTVAIFHVTVKSSEAARARGLEIQFEATALVDGRKAKKDEDAIEPPEHLGWLSQYRPSDDWRTVNKAFAGQGGRIMRTDLWEGYYAVLQPKDTAISGSTVLLFEDEESKGVQ